MYEARRVRFDFAASAPCPIPYLGCIPHANPIYYFQGPIRQGFLSIEPHMKTVYHAPAGDAPEEVEEAMAAARYETYITYGRKLMELAAETRC